MNIRFSTLAIFFMLCLQLVFLTDANAARGGGGGGRGGDFGGGGDRGFNEGGRNFQNDDRWNQDENGNYYDNGGVYFNGDGGVYVAPPADTSDQGTEELFQQNENVP